MPARPQPLLPTHGWTTKKPKRRQNVFFRLVMATIVIAVCAYGGFAWAYLGHKGTAKPQANSHKGERVLSESHGKQNHNLNRGQHNKDPHISDEKQKRHGSIMHEATQDLHHPTHDSQTAHSDEVHQLAADLQHQADVQQQILQHKAAEAHAPLITSTQTTTTTPSTSPSKEQSAPDTDTGLHLHQQQQHVADQQHTPLSRTRGDEVHAPGTSNSPVKEAIHASDTTAPHKEVEAPHTKAPQGEGFYGLSALDIDGHEQSLSKYQGLMKVYDKYHEHGLEILGFPCNQFGAQEPGSLTEIKHFCSSKYHVSFPMFSKVDVNGPHAHPVFQYLKRHAPVADGGGGGTGPGEDISWNFYKFLVDKRGRVIKRWSMKWDKIEVEKEVYAALLHDN